jgi:hypothetical protein
VLGSLGLAAALLLCAAGLAKLRTPEPAAAMLRRALPSAQRGLATSATIRLAAAAEVAVACVVVVDGGRLTHALLAGCYLTFAVVALRLALLPQRASCGCFGATDSPVGSAHVVLDVAATAIGAADALNPPGRLGGLIHSGPTIAVVGVAQAAVLAYVGFLAMTALPALAAERRRVAP